MLEVEKKVQPAKIIKKNEKPDLSTPDIIVHKYTTETTYENGAKIERRKAKAVNVTKLVNETKKLVKQDIALDKIKELEKIFTK